MQNRQLFLGHATVDIAHTKKPSDKRLNQFGGKTE
jgi:hypothetical protein